MWKHINEFLNDVAAGLDLERDSLVLIATQKSGGPTVSPGSNPAKEGNIVKSVRVASEKDVSQLPALWYDTIKTDHVDFQIVQENKAGAVTVPTLVYAWQHAPFFGNCKIAVNRWVRTGSQPKWDKDLRLAGLKLRASFAKLNARVETLIVSTGGSSASYTAEVETAFKEAHKNDLHRVLILDLTKFMKAAA